MSKITKVIRYGDWENIFAEFQKSRQISLVFRKSERSYAPPPPTHTHTHIQGRRSKVKSGIFPIKNVVAPMDCPLLCYVADCWLVKISPKMVNSEILNQTCVKGSSILHTVREKAKGWEWGRYWKKSVFQTTNIVFFEAFLSCIFPISFFLPSKTQFLACISEGKKFPSSVTPPPRLNVEHELKTLKVLRERRLIIQNQNLKLERNHLHFANRKVLLSKKYIFMPWLKF